MDIKLLVALAGVIVAALSTELNEAVSSLLLNDIGGGLGFTHDPGPGSPASISRARCSAWRCRRGSR